MEDCQGNAIVDYRHVLKIWENFTTQLFERANRPENLEFKTQEEVDEDNRDPYILQSAVKKAIKKMSDKKATGDDDVPRVLFKLLGKDSLKTMTHQIGNNYETGEWCKDFLEVTMIALEKEPKATKCSDH
jgi:hypothetical protein